MKILQNQISTNYQEEILIFSHEINIYAGHNHHVILHFIDFNSTSFINGTNPVIVAEYAKNVSLSYVIDLQRHCKLMGSMMQNNNYNDYFMKLYHQCYINTQIKFFTEI